MGAHSIFAIPMVIYQYHRRHRRRHQSHRRYWQIKAPRFIRFVQNVAIWKLKITKPEPNWINCVW